MGIINSAVRIQGNNELIEVMRDGRLLDPNGYADWILGVSSIRAALHKEPDSKQQETFSLWSKQATTPGTDAEINRVWHAGATPPGFGEKAEVMPIANDVPLLDRLKLFLLPAARANAWPGFNETIEEAIRQLSPVPATPFDAATATTIELVQRGLLTDQQAAEILSNHPAFQEDDQLGVGEILNYRKSIVGLQWLIHRLNVHAGWWSDLETGEPKERNDGELLILVISEIIEGFEGIRKNLMDDKLLTRKMIEVEIADAYIRLADYAGGRNLDVAGAILHKLVYNTLRLDHTVAHRRSENGKKC